MSLETYAGVCGSTGDSGDNGLATSANFGEIYALAFDTSDNLYVCDKSMRKIRKVQSSDQIVIAFAGTGANDDTGDGGAATAATFKEPRSVAVDSQNNVYIGDMGSKKIRRVLASNGNIETFGNVKK